MLFHPELNILVFSLLFSELKKCPISCSQVADDYDEDEEVRPSSVHVNLDPKLLLLLREIHYLSQDPFNHKLPGPARYLI